MYYARESVMRDPALEQAYVEAVFRGEGFGGSRDHIIALNETIEKLQKEKKRLEFEWNVQFHDWLDKFIAAYYSKQMRTKHKQLKRKTS